MTDLEKQRLEELMKEKQDLVGKGFAIHRSKLTNHQLESHMQ